MIESTDEEGYQRPQDSLSGYGEASSQAYGSKYVARADLPTQDDQKLYTDDVRGAVVEFPS